MHVHFPVLPAGVPESLRFFVMAGILVVLLRIPFTGMPLLHLGGIAGTTILITLGVAGVAAEVLTGRAGAPWLIIPTLYVVGFYAAYVQEQRMMPRARADVAAFNANKSLAFDAARQDLLVDDRAATGLVAEQMIANFAVDRAFDHRGLMFQIGAPPTCAHLRANAEFESARITTSPVFFASTPPRSDRAFCVIRMSNQPDRPAVRVSATRLTRRYGTLPADLHEIVLRDEGRGAAVTVRSGKARRLWPIPLPFVGWDYAPNTRQPWRFTAGFVRGRPLPLQAEDPALRTDVALVGQVLGLMRSEDLASRAIGAERLPISAHRASGTASHGRE